MVIGAPGLNPPPWNDGALSHTSWRDKQHVEGREWSLGRGCPSFDRGPRAWIHRQTDQNRRYHANSAAAESVSSNEAQSVPPPEKHQIRQSSLKFLEANQLGNFPSPA